MSVIPRSPTPSALLQLHDLPPLALNIDLNRYCGDDLEGAKEGPGQPRLWCLRDGPVIDETFSPSTLITCPSVRPAWPFLACNSRCPSSRETWRMTSHTSSSVTMPATLALQGPCQFGHPGHYISFLPSRYLASSTIMTDHRRRGRALPL